MFGWIRKNKKWPDSKTRHHPTFDMSLFEGSSQNLFESLAKHWSDDDPHVSVPSSAHLRVKEIELRYALRLPSDFKDYLVSAAPSVTYWDHIGTQWWPASEIKNIPDECGTHPSGQINSEVEDESETYLIFADFLIWSYAWAICCSNGANRGKVALIGGNPDCFVADSFREFLALELIDDLKIHGV